MLFFWKLNAHYNVWHDIMRFIKMVLIVLFLLKLWFEISCELELNYHHSLEWNSLVEPISNLKSTIITVLNKTQLSNQFWIENLMPPQFWMKLSCQISFELKFKSHYSFKWLCSFEWNSIFKSVLNWNSTDIAVTYNNC